MKISKERLRQIILEEIQGLFEWPNFDGGGTPTLDVAKSVGADGETTVFGTQNDSIFVLLSDLYPLFLALFIDEIEVVMGDLR